MAGGGVLVVGAVNVDLVVVAPRLPGPGETVVGPGMERHGGGKGANAAVAAARAGAEVRYVGAVGADDLGAAALEELRAAGVDVTDVAVLDDVATGTALIVVDGKGENQIAVGAGANAQVDPAAVRAALARAAGWVGCVLVSTEIPAGAVAAAVQDAVAQGIPCVLNPAPVLPELGELLTLGPLVTPNAGELRDLSEVLGGEGETVAARAAELAARSSSPVVVTLGADGALVVEPDGVVTEIPAHAPPQVRDTTGAGDTFNGVLAAALAAGRPIGEAARRAGVAASLSVGAAGARAGMPSADEIDAASPG